jgi:hypothetical protein
MVLRNLVPLGEQYSPAHGQLADWVEANQTRCRAFARVYTSSASCLVGQRLCPGSFVQEAAARWRWLLCLFQPGLVLSLSRLHPSVFCANLSDFCIQTIQFQGSSLFVFS